MTLSARVRANRRNAKRSTGPRTQDGKARVSQNARLHGLAVPIPADAVARSKIAALANNIVGEGGSDPERNLALAIAEAQLDLLRVRAVKRELLQAISDLVEDDDNSKRGPDIKRESSLLDLVNALARLERYERRALSRRKSATRRYDLLASAPKGPMP